MTIAQLFVTFGIKPEGWGKANALIRSLRNAAKAYIGMEAVDALRSMVDHATEVATHLVSMSQAMGMSIAQTQEWGYVAQQSGSSLRELSMGMNQFVRYLRLFSRGEGGKQLAGRMKEIGLTARDAKDALSSPEGLDRALFKVSDRLKGMGNDAERAALGTQLFGARAGRAMIADMARGSAGLKELREHYRSLGAELTDGEALGLRKLGNSIKDVHLAWDGLKNKAVATMAPLIEHAVTRITAFLEKHGAKIKAFFEFALFVASKALGAVVSVLDTIGDLIDRAFAGDTGARAILIGVAAAILSVVVPAVVVMGTALWGALAPLIEIGLIAAAVAFAILKLGPALIRVFRDLWKDHVKPELDAIADGFWGLVDSVENIGRRIGAALDAAWTYVKNKAKAAMEWIADELSKIPILGTLGSKIDLGASMKTLAPHPAGATAGVTNVVGPPSVRVPAPAPQNTNVNVHQELTFNGVKDASQAAGKFQDAMDNSLRHSMRGVGGER